jgi:hypothetical protein
MSSEENAGCFGKIEPVLRQSIAVGISLLLNHISSCSGTELVTAERCFLGRKTIEMTQFSKFNL